MRNTISILHFAILVVLIGCKARNKNTEVPGKFSEKKVEKSVSVRGERMYYIEQGTGQPIIFIHGAIGDYNVWALQMDQLSRNNRVIAISRRYAWPNSQPSRYDSFDCTVALHSRDLVAFMDELKIPQAHLIGHSYGAMIALRTAIDQPERVKSLVLGEPVVESIISGSMVGDSLITDFRAKANIAVKHYKDGKDEETMRQFLITVLGSDAMYDVVPQEVRDGWLRNLVEGICISETQDLASISREELSRITQPALLITGEHSPAILRLVSDSLDVVLPGSELKILPGVSHELQGGNPDVFNAMVQSFLASLNE